MKTLILSSSWQFISTYNIDEFLPKKLIDCKIAYIITASKKVPNAGYLDRHRKEMSALNLSYTEIDIEGKNESELREELDWYEVIFVEGWNTFSLLKAVRDSSFENVIKDLISKGVVYVGSSAWAYITCPSIIIATLFDKHWFDKCGITEYAGMNLVPFLIMAHYTDDIQEILNEKAKDLQYPLWVLNDDQALLIRDWEVRLLGWWDEMII